MKRFQHVLLILIIQFGLIANAISQTNLSLLTFDNPSELATCTPNDSVPASYFQKYGIINNPLKDKNSSSQCYQVYLDYGHNWLGTFLNFQLKQPVAINSTNRYLHILHYRQVLNDNWMVCLNTRTAWPETELNKRRFGGNNSQTGDWEDIVIDLTYLIDNNQPLSNFIFGISMDWTSPRDNPASMYYFDEIQLSSTPAPRTYNPVIYTKFPNGQPWLDNRGLHINAHGGQILYLNNKYYWIGEKREGNVSKGTTCYSSKDLLNWNYEDVILRPTGVQTTNYQDIAPGRTIERPKIVYNKTTKKYVLWGHWENGTDYSAARVITAIGDSITGQFKFLKTFRPNGQESKDQGLFQDDDDKVYQFCSSEQNYTAHVAELAPDYLNVKDTTSAGYKRILINLAYEAHTIMKSEPGKYFGIFSLCTGWTPNQANLAYATSPNGDWTYMRNPCVDDKASTTYDTQGAYILKVPNKNNAWIFMADRWISTNVGSSPYVWLPISMRTGHPTLSWYDQWDISVFDSINSIQKVTNIVEGENYYILSQLSDKLLSFNNGVITQWKDDSSRNIILKVEKSGNAYRIRNSVTGQYLTATTYLYFSDSNLSDNSQLWTFRDAGNSFYQLISSYSGKCIDVLSSNTLNGATLRLYAPSNDLTKSFNQNWAFFKKVGTVFAGLESETIQKTQLYPTIIKDHITVELPSGVNSGTIRIINLQGIEVLRKPLNSNTNTVNLSSNLPCGSYIISVEDISGYRFIQKVFVNH